MPAEVPLFRISTLSCGNFFSYAALYAEVSSLGKDVTTVMLSASAALDTIASAVTPAKAGAQFLFIDLSPLGFHDYGQSHPSRHFRPRRHPHGYRGRDRPRA